MWDGLLDKSDRILVLGATNRPLDIDPAILRRMPKRFAVGLPDTDQRRRILELVRRALLTDRINVVSIFTFGPLTLDAAILLPT